MFRIRSLLTGLALIGAAAAPATPKVSEITAEDEGEVKAES